MEERTPAWLETKLGEFRALPAETEWVEFKEAKTTFDTEKLGEYFAALSNEANLKGQPCGWLIFGVEDKAPRKIVGSQYKADRAALDLMKKHVADQTSQRLTFREIYELQVQGCRVLMFEIPAAPPGVPTSWKGHYFGRDGESLGALNAEEYERIRAQAVRQDWSAQVIDGATLGDLDADAVAFARAQFVKKNPKHIDDASAWDVATFLNKAKICIGGRVTRAALLLLGRADAAHFLSPAVAELSWRLNDASGTMRDYEHIGLPFLFAGDAVLKKIRNLKVRHMPGGSLFPEEVTQYDERVLREAIHNCIAHQDYRAGARINVVENDDELVLSNRGAFIPVTVEHVIESDEPPDVYRNPFLAQAMVSLNMIDTMGSGIRRMFSVQRARSFPLPDYDLSAPDKVVVRISGRILDENYTRLLLANTSLDLADVVALDKVQKKKPIDDTAFSRLKRAGLIAGRRPNLFVSASIAAATNTRADFIKNRAFDKEHYSKMVVAYLEQYGKASFGDFKLLLLSKLSDALSTEQKERFISNLLQEMRRERVIEPHGTRRHAVWALTSDGSERAARDETQEDD